MNIQNLLSIATLGSLAIGAMFLLGCANESTTVSANQPTSTQQTNNQQANLPEVLMNPEELTEAQWKERLTKEQYDVLRKAGTERAFNNEYWDEKTPGTYLCGACNQALYDSETKYKSGTGWPSFYQPIDPQAVEERADNTLLSSRTEIICSNCKSHIGHVFTDGPEPTGLRYCMNSAALKLEPKEKQAEE